MASDYFFATLNGQTYYNLYLKVMNLDRTVTSFKDRKKNVEKLLGDNSYLVEYFSKYFNPCLTSMNHLSDGNNICHLMEVLANYLLMSDEVKKIDGRKKTYYIDSTHLDRMPDKPGNINEQNGNNNSMIIKFNRSNYKIDKKVKIKAKDFDKTWCGRVLKDQQVGIDNATYKMRHHLGNNYKLARMKHELHADQIQTKTLLKGIFDLDNFKTDSSANDYYATLSEPQTVRAMLRMPHCKAINKDVTQLLWIELQALLPKIKFSKSEFYALWLYSQGWSYRDIAKRYRNNDGKLHPVSEQYISQILNKLYYRIAHIHSVKIDKRIRQHYHLNTKEK